MQSIRSGLINAFSFVFNCVHRAWVAILKLAPMLALTSAASVEVMAEHVKSILIDGGTTSQREDAPKLVAEVRLVACFEDNQFEQTIFYT